MKIKLGEAVCTGVEIAVLIKYMSPYLWHAVYLRGAFAAWMEQMHVAQASWDED